MASRTPLELQDQPGRCPFVYREQLQCARPRHDDDEHGLGGIGWRTGEPHVRNGDVPMLDVDQQAAFFDANIKAAVAMLPRFFVAHCTTIADLARERLLTLGVEQYGDAMWHQSPPELSREVAEELADAVNRLVVVALRGDEPAPLPER